MKTIYVTTIILFISILLAGVVAYFAINVTNELEKELEKEYPDFGVKYSTPNQTELYYGSEWHSAELFHYFIEHEYQGVGLFIDKETVAVFDSDGKESISNFVWYAQSDRIILQYNNMTIFQILGDS